MDTLHGFTFFRQHDGAKLLAGTGQIVVDNDVIVIYRLAAFPARALEPLFHEPRRNVSAVDQTLADDIERRRSHKHQHRIVRQALFDFKRREFIQILT